MMDTPALAATRFVRLVLRSSVFYLSNVAIASMTMVKKAWMLAHPAHLTRVTQNFTSFLNSPLILIAVFGFFPLTVFASGNVAPSVKYTSYRWAAACSLPNVFSDGAGACTCVSNTLGYPIVAQWSTDGTNVTTCTISANGNYFLISIGAVYVCPANSTGATTCTCNNPTASDPTNYVPDEPLHTSCVPQEEHYTLSVLQHPLPDVEPGSFATPYVEVVNTQTNQPKEGAVVNIKVEVDASSGGHDHGESMAKRNKGTLGGCAAGTVPGTIDCTTGSNGRASFNFGAPDASGTHTFTATCISHACSGTKTSDINVKVAGLIPIPSDPSLYVLIGGEADKKHHDNHYLTDNAMSQLTVLAINYHFLYPNEPVLHLNDASLVWGGKFDIKGNWVGDHGAHRRGTVIDIRANTTSGNIPERLFTDFEDMAANTKLADGVTSANAELHCSSGRDPSVDNCVGDDNRHYHVILLGVDQ